MSKMKEYLLDRYEREGSMKLVNFYEVADHTGAIWGGASSLQAVEWFKKGLDYKVYVSVWDETDIEEPRLVTDKIDVTKLIQATIFSEKEKS